MICITIAMAHDLHLKYRTMSAEVTSSKGDDVGVETGYMWRFISGSASLQSTNTCVAWSAARQTLHTFPFSLFQYNTTVLLLGTS